MWLILPLIRAFFRLCITPIKPGPAAITDPVLGISGQNGAMPDVRNASVILSALSNNGSPAFGNWSQTLVASSLLASTLTGGQLVGGIIKRFAPTAASTDSTDTGTNIVNAIPGAVVGQSFPLLYANLGSAANSVTMTLGAGSGVTITGTNTITSNSIRLFLGTITASNAVTLTSCFQFGIGANATTAL